MELSPPPGTSRADLIRQLLTRLPCLLLLVALPTRLTTGPSHGDDDRLTVILPSDPQLTPEEIRAVAAVPVLNLPKPTMEQGWRGMPPLPFADLPSLPPVAAQPSWLTAWHGDTPDSRPSQARRLSEEHPDQYAAWLASQLPSGSRVRVVWATVTAYCPCSICCSRRTEVTADGSSTLVHPYGIAADWRQLPEGSQVHVPGYLTESNIGGIWPVDDTGGALRRSYESTGEMHLDVRFVAHGWAARWGVRHQWVYLIDPPAVSAPGAAPTPPPAPTPMLASFSLPGR